MTVKNEAEQLANVVTGIWKLSPETDPEPFVKEWLGKEDENILQLYTRSGGRGQCAIGFMYRLSGINYPRLIDRMTKKLKSSFGNRFLGYDASSSPTWLYKSLSMSNIVQNNYALAPVSYGDRVEHNHLFRWYEQLNLWHNTTGTPVMVVPPTMPEGSWYCITPSVGRSEEISGEGRAFSVAAARIEEVT